MQEHVRDYELIVIASPLLDDPAVAAFTERIAGWVMTNGGTMAKTNVWGRRPLAYPVRKHREGIYMQFNYQLAPSAGRELERNLKIDEQVIRYLVVRLDSE